MSSRLERHPWLVTFVVLVVMGLVIATVAEIWMKLNHQPTAETLKSNRVVLLKEYGANQSVETTPPPEILADSDSLEARPYRLRTDENGFIAPSAVHGAPQLSIAFLGGSQVEAYNVPEMARFPYLMGRSIEDRLGLRTNVYNAGVGGANSMQMNVVLLTKIVPMRPNVAVLLAASNDLGVHILLNEYWNHNPTRGIVVNRESAIPPLEASLGTRAITLADAIAPNLMSAFRTAKDKLKAMAVRPPPPAPGQQAEGAASPFLAKAEPWLADYRSSLKTFVAVARAWNIEPVLVTEPNRLKDDPDPVVRKMLETLPPKGIAIAEYVAVVRRYNDIVREVGAATGTRVVDLERLVPKESLYLYDAWHFNETGSKFVADILAREVAQTAAATARLSPAKP